jgi:hypothetical protein
MVALLDCYETLERALRPLGKPWKVDPKYNLDAEGKPWVRHSEPYLLATSSGCRSFKMIDRPGMFRTLNIE